MYVDGLIDKLYNLYNNPRIKAELIDSCIGSDSFNDYYECVTADNSDSEEEVAVDFLDERFADFVGGLDYNQQSDKIQITRHMNVLDSDTFTQGLNKKQYTKGYKGLGLCWSWDGDKAEAHWGGAGVLVEMFAEVSIAAIDIKDTLFLNLDYSCGEDEAEIRLKEGSRVQLKMITDFTTKYNTNLKLVA